MLPDFELIQHEFPDRPDITIVPVGDVHLGSNECMEEEFFDFLKMVKMTPDVYIMLLGDLLDNATKNSIASPFQSRYRPAEQKKLMAKLLEPVEDRILCGVQGNHEARSMKDADDCPLYDIMCKLDIEHLYREGMAITKIRMGNNRSNGEQNPTYILGVTHGAGGGATTGAAVNRCENFSCVFDGVDAFVFGHSHKPFLTAPEKIKVDPRNNIVTRVPLKVITATAWLRYGGYPVKRMLRPASHCLQTMTLKGRKKEIIVTM